MVVSSIVRATCSMAVTFCTPICFLFVHTFCRIGLRIPIRSRTGFGYTIHTTAADSDHCGGISLLVRESDSFGVEEVKVWGENVISFELQVGQGEKDRLCGSLFSAFGQGGEGAALAGDGNPGAAGGSTTDGPR